MTKQRTPLERAAGKLILAVQQQWDAELGEPSADVSEEVMHNSHDLLSSAKDGSLQCASGLFRYRLSRKSLGAGASAGSARNKSIRGADG